MQELSCNQPVIKQGSILATSLTWELIIEITYMGHIKMGAGFNSKQRLGELKPAQSVVNADEVKHPIAWFCRREKVGTCRHPCHLGNVSHLFPN